MWKKFSLSKEFLIFCVLLFPIDLREAREPGTIQQAVTDKVTATTIQFRFVAPHDTGLDFENIIYVDFIF